MYKTTDRSSIKFNIRKKGGNNVYFKSYDKNQNKNDSLSTKLWSMLGDQRRNKLNMNPKVKKELKTMILKRSKSLKLPDNAKEDQAKLIKAINTKTEEQLLKQTANNFKLSFDNKYKEICKLTLKKLGLRLSVEKDLCEVWKSPLHFEMTFILCNPITKEELGLKIKSKKTSFIKQNIKILNCYKFFDIKKEEKYIKGIKQEIESLYNKISGKLIFINFTEEKGILDQIYKMNQVKTFKNSFMSKRQLYVDKRNKELLNYESSVKSHEMDIFKKILIYFLKNLLEKPFESNNSHSMEMDDKMKEKLVKRMKVSQNFDLNNFRFDKHEKKNSYNDEQSNNKITSIKYINRKPSITKTILKGNSLKSLRNISKQNIMSKKNSNIGMNSILFSESGSFSSIIRPSHKLVKIYKMHYKKDNMKEIDKCLNFLQKNNLTSSRFKSFKERINPNNEESISRFGRKRKLSFFKDNRQILNENIDLFRNYIQ